MGYLVGNNSFSAKKNIKMYKIKGQKHENPQWHLGPLGGSHFILYVYKIDDYENCIYAPELTKKISIKGYVMLNIH